MIPETHPSVSPDFASALDDRDVKALRALIKAGAPLNAVDKEGNTPLHDVCGGDASVDKGLRLLTLFLEAGAPVNATNIHGDTPLHLAVQFSYGDPVLPTKALIERNADVCARNAAGLTPLHFAASSGNADAAKSLLRAGADPNAVDQNGDTPLLLADEIAVWKALKAAKANTQAADSDGNTLFHRSVHFLKKGACKWLVAEGLDPNAPNRQGRTPLHVLMADMRHAATIVNDDRHKELIKQVGLLLAHGANAHLKDSLGDVATCHAMYYAAAKACARVGKGWWDAKNVLALAEVPKFMATGGRSLFDAILAGDKERLRALIAAGHACDVTGHGWTGLHVAAFAGADRETIHELIEGGVKPDTLTGDGFSALMLAMNQHQAASALVLIDEGADVTRSLPPMMASPILSAAEMGNLALFKVFAPHANDDDRLNALSSRTLVGEAVIEAAKAVLDLGTPASRFDLSKLLSSASSVKGEVRRQLIDLAALLLARGAPAQSVHAAVRGLHALTRDPDAALAQTARNLLVSLITAGLQVKMEQGESLLHWAIEADDLELVKVILATGQDLVMPTRDGRVCVLSPLRTAVGRDNVEIVKALLEAGKRVVDPAMIEDAQQACKSLAMTELLVSGRGGPAEDTQCALAFEAASKRKYALLADLFKQGLSPNVSMNGVPLIVASVRAGDALTILITAGADVNAQGVDGNSALHESATWRSDVEALLKAGANPNLVNVRGETPLMRCLSYRGYFNDSGLKAMIAAGANVNAQDHEGRTALMLGVDRPPVVSTLIKAGASISLRDARSVTALGCASNAKTIEALIKAGADPNDCGADLLARALEAEDMALTIFLLDKGTLFRNCEQLSDRARETLSRLARSRSEVIQSQIGGGALAAADQVFLSTLLGGDDSSISMARLEDLPEVLREGGWPVPVPKREPIVISRALGSAAGGFKSTMEWSETERTAILAREERTFRSWHTKCGKAVAERAILAMAAKSKPEYLSMLMRADEHVFVDFWNSHAAECEPAMEADTLSSRLRPADLNPLVARFGLAILPGILQLGQRKPGLVIRTLRKVNAIECATLMAKSMAGGTTAPEARRWLCAHPEAAIRGLIAHAVGRAGKERDAAEPALRYLSARGFRRLIELVAGEIGADVMKAVDEILSADLRADFLPRTFPRMPPFWAAGDHPAPRLADSDLTLPMSAVNTIARMMSVSTYDAPTPALEDVKAACNPKSLGDFAWSVFETWKRKGNTDSKWMYHCLGYFGDDACARKLTPHIRDWPQSGGTANALLGLDILGAMASDAALAQVQVIALKSKYATVSGRAEAMLDAIADARELDADQLADRLVPTMGLENDGTLALPFGPRRFVAKLDEQLRPRLCDESGAAVKDLPKPTENDDASLAAQSAATWKELRKEIKAAANLQLARLEKAMIDGRRWRQGEFEQFLVRHPLLQSAVRGLVWGVLSDDGKLRQSFRVTNNGAFVDAAGKLVAISAQAFVGVPHPLALSDKIESWKQAFAKAKQGQPFPQLVRKTFRPCDDADADLFGLQGATVPSMALKSLKGLGWDARLLGAADVIECFSRGSAELYVEPGIAMTNYTVLSTEQRLDIRLSELGEVEFSEVIRELQSLRS